jgi:hypothetical protein
MKYMNYFLQKHLSVGAILKKNDVGYDEFEVVHLVGEWAHIRSIYSEKMELVPVHVLCDEYRYFYTRKKVKAVG